MLQAKRAGADLIALPELCVGLDAKDGLFVPAKFPETEHPALAAFSKFAASEQVEVLVGSIGVLAPDGRTFNRSYMIDSNGRVRGRYDKIHLFDIDLGADGVYCESATIAPGHRAVLAPCMGTQLGMSICYDLRFPHLFRAYACVGANLLSVPAAFSRITGAAHWHALLRARAIENGAFVIAPAQCGTLECGAEVYGHSLIIDPWGQVLADGGDTEGIVSAEIDLQYVHEARRKIPALANTRSFDLPRAGAESPHAHQP